MKCSKCKEDIKKAVAWIKCKPYCEFCYELVKTQNKSHPGARGVKSFWDHWIQTQEKTE